MGEQPGKPEGDEPHHHRADGRDERPGGRAGNAVAPDELIGRPLEHFQEKRHVDGVVESHLPQPHQDAAGHRARVLRIEHGRDQRDGHMVAPDMLRPAGGGADGAGGAGLDAGPATDALGDNADRAVVPDADRLGRADPQAGGAAGAALFVEPDVVRELRLGGHVFFPSSR